MGSEEEKPKKAIDPLKRKAPPKEEKKNTEPEEEKPQKRPSVGSVALPGLAYEIGEPEPVHDDHHHINLLHDEIPDHDSEEEDAHLYTDEAHIDQLHLEISDDDSEDSA